MQASNTFQDASQAKKFDGAAQQVFLPCALPRKHMRVELAKLDGPNVVRTEDGELREGGIPGAVCLWPDPVRKS